MGFWDDIKDDPIGSAIKMGGSALPVLPGIPLTLGQFNAGREGVQNVLGGDEQPQLPGNGAASRVSEKQGHRGPTPIMDYLMRQDPSLGRKEARRLARDFKTEQAAPALAAFAQQRTGQPDPATMQMFFAKTVAPYLKGVGQQFEAGQNAGVAAMENILANSANSPGLDIIRQFLPAQKAGGQSLNAALQAATVTAPYYDQLLNQLQEGISQQQRTQALTQQLAVAPTQTATGPTFGQQAAALAAQGK